MTHAKVKNEKIKKDVMDLGDGHKFQKTGITCGIAAVFNVVRSFLSVSV